MEIWDVPTLLFIRRMHFFFYFILSVTPHVFSAVKLSDRRHPHLSNAFHEEALLGFMSVITYDPYQSLPISWKPHVSSFCEWMGVKCSRHRQRVVSLNVSSMGLQEYVLGGCATTKGDVYSCGILLLEILNRKNPTNNIFVDGMNLLKWEGSDFLNRVKVVVDGSLLRRTSMSTIEDKELNCLSQLISVGLLCTKESPEARPTMMDIVSTLQSIKETFLGATGIPKFQSEISHLLGSTSTTHNNIGKGQSSTHNNIGKGQSYSSSG